MEGGRRKKKRKKEEEEGECQVANEDKESKRERESSV